MDSPFLGGLQTLEMMFSFKLILYCVNTILINF